MIHIKEQKMVFALDTELLDNSYFSILNQFSRL